MAISRMQEPRQLYGLGSLVKSIGKTVKKVVKSPIGKAALLAAVGFGIPGTQFGGLLGRASFGGAAPSIFGKTGGISALLGQKAMTTAPYAEATGLQKFLGKVPGGGYTVGAIGSILAASGMSPEEIEETKRDPEKVKMYLRDYYSKTNPDKSADEVEEFVNLNVSEYAVGGRVGFFKAGLAAGDDISPGTSTSGGLRGNGGDRDDPADVRVQVAELTPKQKKFIDAKKFPLREGLISPRNLFKTITNPDLGVYDKGIFGYGEQEPTTKEEYNEYLKSIGVTQMVADGGRIGLMGGAMPMGIMKTNKAGTIERDYRETGGFVPVGIKEKADDVPAMLSNNEFVMTADAVRGIGDGNIEKGAQRLYDQMKTAEKRVV